MKRAFTLIIAGGMALTIGSFVSAQQDDYIRPGPVTRKGLAPNMRVKQLSQSPRSFQIVLGRGDDVMSGLTEFADRYNLKAGQITAVAGLGPLLLGWGDPGPNSKGFKKIPVDAEVETVITGNFTLDRDGKPRVHLHLMGAYPDGHTVGGHVIEARVGLTFEGMVTELQTDPDAKFDKEPAGRGGR
jgi:uncharacterized protein